MKQSNIRGSDTDRTVRKTVDKIVLIGYRGAGKSTIARELSRQSGLESISTDELICEQVKMSIEDFVESNGWPAFRRIEEELVDKVCRRRNVIVDCGGGVVSSANSMSCLASRGLMVHVFADMETIRERLRNAPRPLLAAANLDDDISSTFASRNVLYQRWADIRVNTHNETATDLAHSIYRRFSQMQIASNQNDNPRSPA